MHFIQSLLCQGQSSGSFRFQDSGNGSLLTQSSCAFAQLRNVESPRQARFTTCRWQSCLVLDLVEPKIYGAGTARHGTAGQ